MSLQSLEVMISLALENRSYKADEEEHSHEWWVFRRSCELFTLWLYILFAIATIVAVAQIYLTNGLLMGRNVDTESQAVNDLTSTSIKEDDLYPSLNISGLNEVLYLRTFKREQFSPLREETVPESGKKVYTIEQLLSMRPQTQTGISREILKNFD